MTKIVINVQARTAAKINEELFRNRVEKELTVAFYR